MPRLEPRLLVSATALILANLIPLGFAAAGIWSLGTLLALYWAENLIIGFFTLVKILMITRASGERGGYVFALIFTAKYGAFCLGHGLILTELFIDLPPNTNLPGYIFGGYGLLVPFLVLFASHAVSFGSNFIRDGAFDPRGAEHYSARPFSRIFVLHLTLVAAAFALILIGTHAATLVLFVLIKIGVDLRAHLAANRAAPAET